jgi:hypothetical protein
LYLSRCVNVNKFYAEKYSKKLFQNIYSSRNLSKRAKIFENVENFKKLKGIGPETPPNLPQTVKWGTTIFLKILNDPKWEPDS